MALTKKTIVLFPPELHRRLARVAAERHTSQAELVRRALRAGVWGAFARRETGGGGAADQPSASGLESGADEARIFDGYEKTRAVILVDSDIFMYAAVREHPHRAASVGFLSKVADGTIKVLQEISHRYTSIKRREDGRVVYDSARVLFPEVLPVTAEVVDCARRLLDGDAGVGARDAVHAHAVEVSGLKGICSFDRDFDRIRVFC